MITNESIELIKNNIQKPMCFWNNFDNREYAASISKNRNEYKKKYGASWSHSTKNEGELEKFFPTALEGEPKDYWGKYENVTKPLNFWNIFANREYAASLCNSRSDYGSKYPRSYQITNDHEGEMDILFPISDDVIPIEYWNIYDNAKNESLKYKYKTDLLRNCHSCFTACKNNGWLDEFFPEKKLTYNDITLEMVIDIANECVGNKDTFIRKFSAYDKAAKLNGWMDTVDNIIGTIKRNPPGYLTKEMIVLEAAKYETRADFRRYNYPYYKKAYKSGWLEELDKNFKPAGHEYSRAIYVFEFQESNVCYVGLTYNFTKRKNGHSKSGPVFGYVVKTGESYIFKELTEFVHIDEAKRLEAYYIDKYRNEGWNMLNSAKAGAIGYGKKRKSYTKEYCIDIANKYTSQKKFNEDYPNLFRYIRKNKWFNELFSHVSDFKINIEELTYDECFEKAKLFKNKSEFKKVYHPYYKKSEIEGWFIEFFGEPDTKPFRYWYDFEIRKACASECKTRMDYKNKHMSSYSISVKHKGELDLFFPIIDKNIEVTNLETGEVKIYKDKKELFLLNPDFKDYSINLCLRGKQKTYLNHTIKYLQ